MSDERDTSDRLRKDIDRGKGGDKVGFPDPAAAPLGTDAEAGGNPPTREELKIAREQEVTKRPDGRKVDAERRPVTKPAPTEGQDG